MSCYYSKSTGGFYTKDIHGNNIPADAVEISTEERVALGVSESSGMRITADEKGYPIAIEPPLPINSKASLLAKVAAKRWQVETEGIMVDGRHIATDRESQAQLISAYTLLKSELIPDTPWKTADGTFVRVTLAQIEPVTQAVAERVRACFAAEEIHCQAIAALQTQDELDSYDIDAGWPV